MSSRNMATSDNNSDNGLQTNDVYIYKGGKINETDRYNIKNVRIDEGVSVIDEKAFHECVKLQTVKFKEKNRSLLKKIGNASFCSCNNLLSIDLQDTQLESIGDGAFAGDKLTTVQFPATIRKIGRSCFADCTQLKAVDLSHANHLESIEESTFYNCSALTTINLPPTTSSIGKRSFCGCKALEAVDLRATCVKDIGSYAFSECTNLTNIYFPTTTKCIGQYSIYGCKKLAYLDLQATSVESIGDFGFLECSNLKTINFPKTLKYIGENCFLYCDSLECLNLQETSIERIGDRAFRKCTNLQTIVGISTSHRGEQLQEIMYSESFQLPATLVEIGEDAFDGCPALKNSIDNNWIHYQCDVNRGGRQFLQRDHRHHESNNDGDAKLHGKVYYSSLWPLILFRVMHGMKLPKHRICTNDDDLALYTKANSARRRASVVFDLLIHGVVADLQPSQSAAAS